MKSALLSALLFVLLLTVQVTTLVVELLCGALMACGVFAIASALKIVGFLPIVRQAIVIRTRE